MSKKKKQKMPKPLRALAKFLRVREQVARQDASKDALTEILTRVHQAKQQGEISDLLSRQICHLVCPHVYSDPKIAAAREAQAEARETQTYHDDKGRGLIVPPAIEAKHVELSEKARAALTPTMTPEDFEAVWKS